jgi:hypothetical protein
VRELTDEDLDLGNLIDLDEFIGMIVEGEIEDSDGYGFLVWDNDVEPKELAPSELKCMYIPDDFTHILWFQH